MTPGCRLPARYWDGYEGPALVARILALTADAGEHAECRVWLGGSDGAGRPVLSRLCGVRRRCERVYRVVEAAVRGPLPPREPVHHRCARVACVAPWHVERSTARDNGMEALQRAAYERRIALLEHALSGFAPDHPTLAVVE